MFKDRVNEYYPKDDVYCYGQELNPATFATCKADILLRGGMPAISPSAIR